MDSDSKYWLSIWTLVATVIVTLIITIALYNIKSNQQIVDMVKDGADPIAARCALTGMNTNGDGAICAVAATSNGTAAQP